MPEPFKNLISTDTIAAAGHHLSRVWPAFERPRFEQLAGHGLEALEMKDRAMQIAAALQSTLPDDFDHATALIEAALAPPASPDQPTAGRDGAAGLSGWIVWSLGEYVTRQVTREPPRLVRGLAALHALTQRFSAEFAIRPLIRDHPDDVFDTLMRWRADPSPHVRRLVSEGSRPRLPWGLRLLALVADWLHRHLPGASASRGALLRHASRSLIKQGHPATLAAWGLGRAFRGTAALTVAPARIAEGGELSLTLTLASGARTAQSLVVDYVVHHVRANGDTSAKVFKGWSFLLPAGAGRERVRRHSMRPITTRRYYPGWHRVQVQVNGKPVAEGGFELVAGPLPAAT